MRILQVGKYYAPAHGGIETILQTLSEGLARSGDEVTVLCSAHPGWREGGDGREELLAGVRVVRAPRYGTWLSQPLSPALPVELRSLARRFDLVHVHTPNPLAEAAALAIPQGIPLVVSHHSDVVRQKLVLPFYRPVLRRFLERASRIVVATPHHVSRSELLPEFAGKCQVIPYGIDPGPYEPDAALEARARALRAEHGRFVLFVGRLVPYKGVAILIDAMRDLDANLVIVGDGPLRAELERRSREAGLAARIRFAGQVADSRGLAAYYHACEAFALPSVSRNEAFGVVQLEAMACARPVVTTLLDSGVTLVNEDGVTGLHVPPADPGALARALRSLLEDDARRLAMGRAARERFERLFTRDRMVSAYRELYSSLSRREAPRTSL